MIFFNVIFHVVFVVVIVVVVVVVVVVAVIVFHLSMGGVIVQSEEHALACWRLHSSIGGTHIFSLILPTTTFVILEKKSTKCGPERTIPASVDGNFG